MNFVSWAFVALFLVVFAARLTIGRFKVEQPYVALLIVASALFYAWHIPVYLAILVSTAAVDFFAAILIDRTPAAAIGRRRLWLIVSLVTNLGVLALFKYSGFLIQVLEDVTGEPPPATLSPDLALALPIGISFYTFQSMSYTIDVYRGTLAPIRRFWPFFLFISFFPQLVAGPIVRASEFLPQLPRPRRLRLAVFYEGLWLIVLGFFLKMVCADNLAVYVDAYWPHAADAAARSGFVLWLSVMFSGQILADFAGYSSIAQGLAYLLGYRLPINFNAPYLADSFKNFWERWHITLSRWLRDYLYVPLGGNRRGTGRTYANLLIVMVLGGLWHGAAYTFLIWGALHGIALGVERLLGLHQRQGWAGAWVVRVAWFIVVQAVVLLAWIFFRSQSVDEALAVAGNILVSDHWAIGSMELVGLLFLSPMVAMHLWRWLQECRIVRRPGPLARAALAAAMVYAIATLYAGTANFIYFQF